MFIGSEGTMGIITDAWMRLQGRVKFRANASISFKSFYEGAKAVRQITQAGLFPANARYLDEQDAKFYGAGDGTDPSCCWASNPPTIRWTHGWSVVSKSARTSVAS